MTPDEWARLARLGPAERAAFRGYLLSLRHPRPAGARRWQRLDHWASGVL